ncbi:hypothetical protein [Pendulispora albinea]|uniref:DUF2076 domain-containing protein n=1 Tax=Pendulispora albinea TaxID=2741071 RepID=A0ABZ2LV83_9BACT
MGILDRLFGGTSSSQRPANFDPGAPAASPARPAPSASGGATSDEDALRRYRYLLRTAPPEAIEQAHAEAFAQLTPEQRAQALRSLAEAVPEGERRATQNQTDPQALARMATRAELRQPGVLERVFGGGGMLGGGGGMASGMGGAFAGSLLGSIAGSFIGSSIASHFLGGFHDASPFANLGSDAYGGAAPEAGSPGYYDSPEYGAPGEDASDTVQDVDYDGIADDVDPGDDFGDFGDFGDDI